MTRSTTGAPASVSRSLHAGPISLKFEDGELRYLYVGQKEIIRRVYFGVRDGSWNTAMPKFTNVAVEDGGDHFFIKLSASCKLEKVDYSWEGTINGTADGRIAFQAAGTANADFASNRIGLCVLYGAPSLKGQKFEAMDDKNAPKAGEFPERVSNKLVAERFQALRYTFEGMQISCAVTGATFDMEDQRNWGDSSFKAYAPLRYKYPAVKKGEKQTQTVTIAVASVSATEARVNDEPVHLRLTDTVIGKLPKFVPSTPFRNAVAFQDISFARERFKGAKVVIWLYTPTVHLPDNDVIMENVPAVCDQARTVKDFAADATLRVGAALRSPKVNEGRDPRAATPFAAAWATALLKYLACGNVEETAFDLGPGVATQMVDAMKADAGKDVLDVTVDPRLALHPTAFAIPENNSVAVWIANRQSRTLHVSLDGLTGDGQAKIARMDEQSTAEGKLDEREQPFQSGQLLLDLPPYGVCRVLLTK